MPRDRTEEIVYQFGDGSEPNTCRFPVCFPYVEA